MKYLSLLLCAYLLYSGYKVYSVGHSDSGGNADCAIVLGAAAWHKKPSPVLASRPPALC